jgi:hypothetical protein
MLYFVSKYNFLYKASGSRNMIMDHQRGITGPDDGPDLWPDDIQAEQKYKYD